MAAGIGRSWRGPGPWGPGLMLSLLLAMAPATASAAQIYQWKDANGVVHFSDNPDAVPVQDRGKSERQVEPLAGMAPPSGMSGDPGQIVWETKCASCHAYDNNSTERGHLGLLNYILNPDTKFPYPDDVIKSSLEKGIRGNGEGMPAIDVSDEQVNALVKFLAKAVSQP